MTLGMNFPFGREGRADDLSELWEKLSSAEQPRGVLIRRARHADLRTPMRYDRARQNLDRHPDYVLAAYMASGT
jgi:hypothetical protein